MAGKKVVNPDWQNLLIVEDEPRDIKALELILEPEPYNLVFLDNVENALDYLKENKPDLILLDIIFKGMSGFDMCRQLKSDADTCEIPVVFLSAKYDYKDVVKGFEMGAVDYITKPFNPLELVMRIKSHLSLRAAKNQLQRVNKSKDKLFSILSHDLRNPLISIQTGLRLMYERTPEKNEEWMTLYKQMVNISSSTFYLLNSILDWSKTQMNELKPQPRSFPLENMVREVVQLFKGMTELNEQTITYKADPVNIFIDKEMLSVILRNLVSNAIKFTPPGGSVYITGGVANGSLKLTVQDTGAGMEPEQIERLLSPDGKDDMAAISDFGRGLGFSICKELSAKLGGIMQGVSSPNKGTTISVILPANI